MLLSLKIEQDPSFLGFRQNKIFQKEAQPLFQEDLKVFREAVRNSVKIIVPEECLSDNGRNCVIDGRDPVVVLNDSPVDDLCPDDWQKKKFGLYREYAKLPFDTVFFENSQIGCLCTSDLDGKILIIPVYSSGVMSYAPLKFNWEADDCYDADEINFIRSFTKNLLLKWEPGCEEKIHELKRQIGRSTGYLIWQISELLLMMNVSNKSVHTYKTTRKEAPRIKHGDPPKYE